MEPVEFFLAMSSALDVLRWSIRRFGMLKGGTCILSDENWCRRGRCLSGDGRDKLSNFSLLRCCRSMQSNISWRTWVAIRKTISLVKPVSTNFKTHLKQNHELFQIQWWINGLWKQRRHNSSCHHVHRQSILFVAQHDSINVYIIRSFWLTLLRTIKEAKIKIHSRKFQSMSDGKWNSWKILSP